jgi:hypothetical protein
MQEITWYVTMHWPTGEMEHREVTGTADLKDLLDRHAFCQKHGCPMPLTVTIVRNP